MEDGAGGACTDAACAGPDLGEERGRQRAEVSALTATEPCHDSPQSTQEAPRAAGRHLEPVTGSEEQCHRHRSERGRCLTDTDGIHDSLRFPLALKEALTLTLLEYNAHPISFSTVSRHQASRPGSSTYPSSTYGNYPCICYRLSTRATGSQITLSKLGREGTT